MNNRLLFSSLALVLALAGCQGRNDGTPKVASKVESPSAGELPATAGAEKEAETKPDASTKPTPSTAPNPKGPASPTVKNTPPPPPYSTQAVVQAAVQTGQVKVQIPPSQAQGWVKSDLTAEQLAAKVSAAVSSLSNTRLESSTLVGTPLGKGQYIDHATIGDRKKYKFAYVHIGDQPVTGTLVANGKQRVVRVEDSWTNPLPLDKPLPSDRDTSLSSFKEQPSSPMLAPLTTTKPEDVVERWPREFSRLAFQSLSEGKDAVGPAVKGWSSGLKGYRIAAVEKRQKKVEGRQYVSYRIIAKRDKKGGGNSEIELVVDGYRFLPVTMRTNFDDEKGRNFSAMWSGSYKFNEKFVDKDFSGPFKKANKA